MDRQSLMFVNFPKQSKTISFFCWLVWLLFFFFFKDELITF